MAEECSVEICAMTYQCPIADEVNQLLGNFGKFWFPCNHCVINFYDFCEGIGDGVLGVQQMMKFAASDFSIQHFNAGNFDDSTFGRRGKTCGFYVNKDQAHGLGCGWVENGDLELEAIVRVSSVTTCCKRNNVAMTQ